MYIRRTPSFSASVFAIVSMFAGVVAAGCGEAAYSEEHADSIQFDCQQTAPCDPVFMIRSDAVGECIKDTGNKLDRASEAVRANYEARLSRCQGAVGGCAYFACAGDSMLYSLVNEQKLRYDCQQQIVCKIQMGVPMMPTDNDACFQQLSSTLDFASVPDKTSYDQRVARCAAFMGCDYVNCK